MQVTLIQQKCEETLKVQALILAILTQAAKVEIVDTYRNVIILCLVNKVLEELSKENIMIDM